MTNFKQRVKRLKTKLNVVEHNPYATCTDDDLRELAAEVAADAEAHPENYLDWSGVALLAQVRKVLAHAQAV